MGDSDQNRCVILVRIAKTLWFPNTRLVFGIFQVAMRSQTSQVRSAVEKVKLIFETLTPTLICWIRPCDTRFV